MAKKSKTREQVKKESRRLYKEVLKSLKPMIKKYGIPRLRWALNRWNKREGEKNYWLKQRKQADEELRNL